MRKFFRMNMAETLDKVFDVYKASFKRQCLRVMLAGAVTGGVTAVFAIVASLVLVSYSLRSGAGIGMSDAVPPEFIFVALLGAAVYTWLFGMNMTANLIICEDALRGRKSGFGRTFQAAWRGNLRAFTAYGMLVLRFIPPFLAGWAVFTVFLVIYIFAADLSIAGASGPFAPLASVYDTFLRDDSLSGVFAAAFIAVSAGVSAWLLRVAAATYLTVPSAVYEKMRGFSAMKRSKELTAGRLKAIAGLITMWLLVKYAVSGSLSGVFAVIAMLLGGLQKLFMRAGIHQQTSAMASMFVMSVSTLIIEPLSGIMLSVAYFNERVRLEGLDLAYAIEDLYWKNKEKARTEKIAETLPGGGL
ncbi:MAG: hypothetical protein LBU36_01495 [Clostridiales bacterium]|nr:hypothetical protein [Clostridiales bacterium]